MITSKKIVLIGHFGVGKTSLIRRFVENTFSESYKVTIGVHISKKGVQISDEKKEIVYKKGTHIFHENHYPHSMYVLEEGKVKISKIGDEGKEQIVRFAKAGDLILIDAGAEQAYDIAAGLGITTGSWQTLDIPLSTWSSLDLTTIRQFKVVGDGTIYFDNFYFYDSATATASVENNKLLELSMYPNPSSDILNISAANTITNAEIFNVIGKNCDLIEVF